MELKKEDFKKFRIVNTFFYALPIDFFDEKEEVEDAVKAAEDLIAEDLAKKAIEEEEKKAIELAEKKKLAEEKAAAKLEAERLAKEKAELAAKKKAEVAAKKKADLEAKKAQKLKELAELEAEEV